MQIEIDISGRKFSADLSKPLDISLPLGIPNGASAWYVEPMRITPVRTAQFTGSVQEGGSVNFRDIYFNPHGHGTHTECVGHISKEDYTINQSLKSFFFPAILITIDFSKAANTDLVIEKKQVEKRIKKGFHKAVVFRTLPNTVSKFTRNYSNTNPAYISSEAMHYLVEEGIDHVLIDTPSVDREEDGGKLAAHHIFWNYPNDPQLHRTITEFIFAADTIPDGTYLLNLQIAPFENDATPSKPVLYALQEKLSA